jgi:hypothetical protein
VSAAKRNQTMIKQPLPCGHPQECYYFHPSLVGSSRFRCCACDDPQANTAAMQKLIEQGIIKKEEV